MKIVLTDKNIVEAHEITQINTAGQLTFTTTIDSDVKEKIETTDIVFVKVKDDRYHPYKIMQSKMPTAYTIQYTCIEYAYYLFAKDGLVHDKRPNNWTIQKTVFEVIKGTHWQVGYVDPNLPTVTSSFYWITRTECFKKIAELTGAEFEFYMTMSNNQITSRTIEVYKQRGTDTHQRFVYGMNALEVVAEEDATNAVTKIYPRGSGEMYTSEGDGRRKLTISDVVWSKSNGDPTDKPKGQDYLVYGSSTYDLDNGNQPSSIVEFQDEKDENNLIWRAFDWLKQNNRPKVQFKAKVSEVGDLKLGDRVVIDREDLGIKYITRVFKLDRNLLNEKLNTIELGDIVAHTLADAINNVADGVANINNRVNDVTSTLIDGQGNTVTYGADEPSTKKKGDVWYKPSDIVEGIQQYDVYVWDGEKWVLTIGNQIQNELVAKVEQAQKDTAEVQKQAQAASDKATQIEKNFNTQIGEVKANIDSVNTSAQSAMSQAQTAINKAEFNNQEITKIQSQQSADGQRLTTVESNYNGLNQTVKDNAVKQESDRVQLSGLISDKVSNSEFDSFKTQTADRITNVITNTNNIFINSSMEELPLDQTFAHYWDEKVSIVDNPFKGFPEIPNVTIHDGYTYVNNKSPKVLAIKRDGDAHAPKFKVTGGTRFYAEFDFYSNTGSGWLLGVLEEGENGWWGSGGPYTYQTFDQDKWCHWRGYFDLNPKTTHVDIYLKTVGGSEDSVTYFDNIVCTKANIMTSMIQQTQSDITSLVQNTDSLNKRIQTAETTVESISNMTGSNTIVNTVKGQQQQIEDVEGHSMKALKTAQGVQTTVENMSVGGTNILHNTELMDDDTYWATDGNTIVENGVATVRSAWGSREYKADKLNEYIQSHDITDKTFMLSVDIMRSTQDVTPNSVIRFYGESTGSNDTLVVKDLSALPINKWVRYSIPIILVGSGLTAISGRFRIECNTDTEWKFRHMKLEEGNKATDWSPAPSDMSTAKEYSQLIQTVQGIQSTVQNNTGDISKLTQTADGIVTSVGNINNRIGYTYPNFTSTDEGVLHELYELSDGNTWEHIYLSKYSPSSAKTYYQLGFNINNLPVGQKTGVRLKEYIDVTGSTQFTLEFMSEMSAEDTSCAYGRYYLVEYDEHKNQLSNYEFWIKYDTVHDNYQNKATIKLNPAAKYVRPVYVIESRGKACNFFLWDFKVYTDNQSISAQMAVLSDDVSLKVSKNDVVNQINVSTEEILIGGAKTHITNQTTIDNAVITSAMVKDINADTITTGTLNAANVNIVNLDVNRLTGNRGDFISAGIHDACHDLELTGGGITATFKDWSKMTLNTYGLQWRDKDGDPVGSITTEDWLLKNGIADTLLIGAYGGRQITFGLATEANEHLLNAVFNIRRVDTNTRKDELTIEFPNPYSTQLCIGGITGEHEYLRLENYSLNNATYPYITGDSRGAGMFIGKNELYFRRTSSEGYAEVLSLGDIEYGKLKGLSNGRDNITITNVLFNGNNYFALLSPSGRTGVMWGDSRLYFVLDDTVYPLADILRGATWNI